MYAYEIDVDGFIINNYLIFGDVPIPEDCVTTQLPQPLPFYKPKWDCDVWVEGETAQEKENRASIQAINNIRPSKKEIEDAKLEIKSIQIMTELGVLD